VKEILRSLQCCQILRKVLTVCVQSWKTFNHCLEWIEQETRFLISQSKKQSSLHGFFHTSYLLTGVFRLCSSYHDCSIATGPSRVFNAMTHEVRIALFELGDPTLAEIDIHSDCVRHLYLRCSKCSTLRTHTASVIMAGQQACLAPFPRHLSPMSSYLE
jgi:hypothetical protein